MKALSIKILAACTMVIATFASEAQITTPRTPSPAASVTQTIGISNVTVNYSRPAVRGREVWGKMVPYGWNKQAFGLGNDAPWRSGANENTTIEFSYDAKFAGKNVPAGNYGLFFVINEDNSGEVILSKDTQSWGSFFYDTKNDQMRAPIQLREIPHTERLTYDFITIDQNSTELVLNWEKKQFPVKIEFAVNDIVMANAAEELKGVKGFNWIGPNSAANYALQNQTHLEEGLKYANQAVAQNNSFTTNNIKAGLLTATGKTAEADQIIKTAIDIATEAELNVYAYQLMGQNKDDQALEMFLLNSKKYPESANVWDSLGDGYVKKGDTKNAVKAYKKCLSLNPPPALKAVSQQHLKDLGASL
jgi:tetratricopeptide (TPR) repeat protein